MNSTLLKDYRSLLLGGIIATGIALLLLERQLVIIDPDRVSNAVSIAVNILAFCLCWLIVSLLIHRGSILSVLGVLSLLLIAIAAERILRLPINPITFPLLILFWLGVIYLIVPDFFKKYQVPILVVYGTLLSYFFFFRLVPNYVQDYHQNFLRFTLVPLPVLALLWVYEQWRWLKMLKADKAKAELTLLKNQIDPHFFFNTLNNLYGLAVEKSDRAPEMILKLSDMMRYTIYEGQADFVDLNDELHYLEDYIELHKIRYQKKVDISFTKDIQAAHKIAPLLLIVPLENAFKHGVERLSENAFIELDIKTTATSIVYRIQNNFESQEERSRGIGLANLKKRLTLIYPNQHQLDITIKGDTYTLRLEIYPT